MCKCFETNKQKKDPFDLSFILKKNKMAASSSHYQRLCFIPKHRRIIFLFVFHPVNSSFRRLKKNNIKDDELFFCLMSKSLRVVQADGPLWAARNVKWRKFPPQKNGSIYNEYIYNINKYKYILYMHILNNIGQSTARNTAKSICFYPVSM